MSELIEGKGWDDVMIVKIADLHIDMTYQRPRNMAKVRKIGREYDLDLAQYIVVNERGNRGAGRRQAGKLFIVDGAHRKEGAERAGETEMFALMFRGMSREEEASMFRRLNTQRGPVKALDRFKAKLVEKDPAALDIVRIVQSYGSDVNRTPTEDHGINAVEALETLYARDKGASLGATLSLIRGAYGKIDTPIGTAKVLKAVDWFLRHHQYYDRKRLLRRLNEDGVFSLSQKAGAFVAAYGGAAWVGFYLAIIETYNYRLADDKRLMPVSPSRKA